MRNTICYIRVSTEEQSADEKYGIQSQKLAILTLVMANDFNIKEYKIAFKHKKEFKVVYDYLTKHC